MLKEARDILIMLHEVAGKVIIKVSVLNRDDVPDDASQWAEPNSYQLIYRRISRILRSCASTNRRRLYAPYRSCYGITCHPVKVMNTSTGYWGPFSLSPRLGG